MKPIHLVMAGTLACLAVAVPEYAVPAPFDDGAGITVNAGQNEREGQLAVRGGQNQPGARAPEASGVNTRASAPTDLSLQTEEKLKLGRSLRIDPAPVPAADRQQVSEGVGLARPEDASAGAAPRQSAGQRQMSQREEEEAAELEEKEEAKRFRNQLLDESIEKLLPLKPGEIRSYIHRRDEVESAVNPHPAKMHTETRQLSTTPGAAPQVIRLTAGYSSTIMFQDATGAPWPVLSVILGNARAFAVSQPKVVQDMLYESGTGANDNQSSNRAKLQNGTSNVTSNLVNIVPMTNHSSSNLVVTLEGSPYPVILHLLSQSAANDDRIDDALVVFRLDKGGPNAKAPVIGPSIPGAVSEDLLSFVHGVAPSGARRLQFSPEVPGVQAWEYGGSVYLRTMHQAVWPAWTSVAGGDNLQVYVMPKTPSIVVSIDGRRVKMVLQ